MNRRKFKKIMKITSFLVFLSILCLVFAHFIPWFYVDSIEKKGGLYFSLDMAKKSDNLEIQSISEKVNLLTISLWVILSFSLLSYIGLTFYRIEKYELASFLIMLAGGIGCLISSILGLFFNYKSIIAIQESSILHQSLLIYVFYYPYIPFFIMFLLAFLAILYNTKVVPDSIKYFQSIIKKNREIRKKVNRVSEEEVYPSSGKIEDYTESTEEASESEEEVEDWLKSESMDSDLQESAEEEKQTAESEGENKRTSMENIKEYEEKLAGKPFFDKETIGEKGTDEKGKKLEKKREEKVRQKKAVSFENNKSKQKFKSSEKIEEEKEEKSIGAKEAVKEDDVEETPISDIFDKALSSAVEKTGRTPREKDKKAFRGGDSEEKKKDEDTKDKTEFSNLKRKPRDEAREEILKFFHEQRKETTEGKTKSDEVEKETETEEKQEENEGEKDEEKPSSTQTEKVISVRCPVCENVFKTEKSSDGVTRIECPSCGEKGVIKTDK
ncbi:MAG: hypothetical protein V5A64_04180 [Candidatus Thermoplasmatota archaeon]